MENANTHKSKCIKDITTHINIRIMSIRPYEQPLNPGEKLVMTIKSKLKDRKFYGHTLTWTSFIGACEQLADWKDNKQIVDGVQKKDEN